MKLSIEDLKYFAKCSNDWKPSIIEPQPRLPIMAIVQVGDFDDDMDINDLDLEESLIEDSGARFRSLECHTIPAVMERSLRLVASPLRIPTNSPLFH